MFTLLKWLTTLTILLSSSSHPNSRSCPGSSSEQSTIKNINGALLKSIPQTSNPKFVRAKWHISTNLVTEQKQDKCTILVLGQVQAQYLYCQEPIMMLTRKRTKNFTTSTTVLACVTTDTIILYRNFEYCTREMRNNKYMYSILCITVILLTIYIYVCVYLLIYTCTFWLHNFIYYLHL